MPAGAACAEAGLLGLAAPSEHGGEGLGLDEVGVLVRGLGSRAGDLPFHETLVCGLLTLARSATPEQLEAFVPQIVAGTLLVAPAPTSPVRPCRCGRRPSSRATG